MKAVGTDQPATPSALASSIRHAMSSNLVLVGFAEALAAPEVVWSLVDEGFQVIAFARRGRASALRHSRHVVCHEICPPELDLQASLADLRALLVSLGGQPDNAQRILFPLDDKAVSLCSKLQLERPWLLAGPQNGAAELALNKHLQISAARQAGFNVPETLLARSADEIFSSDVAKSFPVILKPAHCVPAVDGRVYEGRKSICASRDELERAVKDWAERTPLLVQQFVTGIGEGVFGLAAPDGIRAWSAHRRLRMMNPEGSGSSACISQPVTPDVRSKTEQLIGNTGWRGLFMIELLRDSSGKLWFMELNGRPWGSMALSRRQGLEYPAWQVKVAIDPESGAGRAMSATPDVVCRHAGREFMHILFVLRGARSKAVKNWPSFWSTVTDVISVHDRDTLYNWRREDAKVFLADCYYTVHDNVFKSRL